MAQYRLSSQVIGRSTGRSAVASAAYRAGQSLSDERTGQVHDFSRRGGVLHAEIMAPANAPDWMRDRARLWNAVEIAERRGDAQLAREIQLSLPHELTDPQRLELVRGFVNSQFVARGMIADFAIHAPGKDGDDRNHHAHIMLTMRELTGEGFGKKARDWNSPELLQTWREQWATQQNQTLERYGHPSRVDHRSLEVQEIDREPTSHLGKHAHQMEQRGKRSRIGEENRAVDSRNHDRARNHQQAVIVNLDIERHRRQHEAATVQRVDALQDAQKLADIDLDRRFHRERLELADVHAKQYGQHERSLRAELSAIDERSKATGWRRVLRSVTGAASRDRAQEAVLRITLGDIANRRKEAEHALKSRQDTERASINAQRVQKVERLRADMAKQGAKREKEILRETKRREWHQRQEQKIQSAAAQAQRNGTRRNIELTPAQQAKQLARQNRNLTRKAEAVRVSDLERELTALLLKSDMEKKPVRNDFDMARRFEQPKPAQQAPHSPKLVSHPTPAPSPMGEQPRQPAKTVQQVPDKQPPKLPQQAPTTARRDFATNAPATPPKPPTPPQTAMQRDWKQPTQTPQPVTPKKDWSQSATPAQTTPAQPTEQTPARKDWSAAATPSSQPIIRPVQKIDRDPEPER